VPLAVPLSLSLSPARLYILPSLPIPPSVSIPPSFAHSLRQKPLRRRCAACPSLPRGQPRASRAIPAADPFSLSNWLGCLPIAHRSQGDAFPVWPRR
jgi:hypothetical protein